MIIAYVLGSLIPPVRFYNIRGPDTPIIGTRDNMKRIDDTDRVILDILRNDSSRSLKTIAKELNMPLTTIHSRINQLKKHGIIKKFTIETVELEEGFEAIILLTPTNYQEVILNIGDEEISAITGEYELMVKKWFKTLEELNDYTKKLSKNSRVINTFVVTKKVN